MRSSVIAFSAIGTPARSGSSRQTAATSIVARRARTADAIAAPRRPIRPILCVAVAGAGSRRRALTRERREEPLPHLRRRFRPRGQSSHALALGTHVRDEPRASFAFLKMRTRRFEPRIRDPRQHVQAEEMSGSAARFGHERCLLRPGSSDLANASRSLRCARLPRGDRAFGMTSIAPRRAAVTLRHGRARPTASISGIEHVRCRRQPLAEQSTLGQVFPCVVRVASSACSNAASRLIDFRSSQGSPPLPRTPNGSSSNNDAGAAEFLPASIRCRGTAAASIDLFLRVSTTRPGVNAPAAPCCAV